ncbi:MAG: transporter substrate-binding domain-containing protein [Desulfobacterales bacterium]|nr:transporter substrate-binding domain-containing protein [Desulfobacterales bacterium]
MGKKFFGLCFVLITFVSAVSAFGAENLLVCTCEWPPYEYTENGKTFGFATEVIKNVLPRLGYNPEIKFVPWKRAVEMVKNGNADGIFSISYNDTRAEFLYYPEKSIHPSEYVLFINKSNVGNLKFDSFEDLKPYRIGVTREYAYSEELWTSLKKFGNYEEVATDEVNLTKLAVGRIDYFPSELLVGLELAKKLKLSDKVTYLDKRFKTKDYFLAFSKKSPKISPELVEKFSNELAGFMETETYKAIYNRYYN